ncbi:MAG: dihydrodipicolinate synthase family protein [Verrucomicrobiota bacterium]
MPSLPVDAPLPILATAVVPWTADYQFDAETFRRQVQTIARGLTRHIYVFGTAGEGYAVSDAQFKEIATCFWQCAQEEGVTPMLGLISLSLPTIVERIAWGRSLGFREFQLSLPGWGALNDKELATFFAETCGRFSDCQFHHYNLARTNRVLTAADYAKLAAAHPNLIAVKASVSDPAIIAGFMGLAPRLQFFFTERGYVEARKLGPCGLLISLASVNYEKAHAYVAGDDAYRTEAFLSLQDIGKKLKEVCAGRYHIDGAFDKMLFRVSDPRFPLRLLPPYESASEADFDAFRQGLPAAWK